MKKVSNFNFSVLVDVMCSWDDTWQIPVCFQFFFSKNSLLFRLVFVGRLKMREVLGFLKFATILPHPWRFVLRSVYIKEIVYVYICHKIIIKIMLCQKNLTHSSTELGKISNLKPLFCIKLWLTFHIHDCIL